jgi:hypothetical protein
VDANVSELIFSDGSPATVKCVKCNEVQPVIPMQMQRSNKLKDMPLVITEFVMPIGWTRIEIFVTGEHEGSLAENLERELLACPRCVIEIA